MSPHPAVLIGNVRAQRPPTRSHAIYMTAVEFKGATTADALPAPPVDPTRFSRGYTYKGPGQQISRYPSGGRWPVTSSVRRS